MPAPSIAQLEGLLRRAWGRPVRISRREPLPPWAVMRCVLDGEEPPSVIVKWLRDDPNGFRIDPRQMATEQAALEFLAEIGFPSAPRLIAADAAAGVVVLEDLAPRTALAERLRDHGLAASKPQLLVYARVLGELGAATAGRAARYGAIRAGLGPEDPAVAGERGLGPDWPDARLRLEQQGLAIPPAADRDLAEVVTTLFDPGPFLALSNGDTQVNNLLIDGEDGKLIDFEAASFRHALTAAVLIHVPGPHWLTVADPFNADLEDAYRTALGQGVPEAEDEGRFGGGLAAASLAWACDRLSRFARVDRRPAGDDSRVQLIATLEAAAGVAHRHRAFPQLAGWQERAAQWLRRRWPDADIDLAGLAPYTPRR